MTTHTDRAAIETLRYRLHAADDERRRANALDSFRRKLETWTGAPVQARPRVTLFSRGGLRVVAGNSWETLELSPDEVRELDEWLRSLAYKRRAHADSLELKAARDGGQR